MTTTAPHVTRTELKSLAYHLRRCAALAAKSGERSAWLVMKKALLVAQQVLARHGVDDEGGSK